MGPGGQKSVGSPESKVLVAEQKLLFSAKKC